MMKFSGIGRMTRDVEIRNVTIKGEATNVADVTVACNGSKNKDGTDNTFFVRFTVWGKQADAWQKYTAKGTMVYIEGEPIMREYAKKDGSKGMSFELVRLDNSEWLTRKEASAKDTAPTNYDKPVKPVESDADEDLPF